MLVGVVKIHSRIVLPIGENPTGKRSQRKPSLIWQDGVRKFVETLRKGLDWRRGCASG